MVVFFLICEAYRTKEKKRKWVVFGKAWERHTPTEERLGPWMSGHPCETPWETFCGTCVDLCGLVGLVGLGKHFRHSQASSVGGKETAAAVVLEEEGEENGHMAIVANPLLSAVAVAE